MNDLTGRKFGRLTVLHDSGKRASNKSIIWSCVCSCGNKLETRSSFLTRGQTTSCGCFQKELATEKASELHKLVKSKDIQEQTRIKEKTVKRHKELYYVEGIDTTALTAKKRKDNKSGVRGVSWDKSRNRWKVDICVGGKKIALGRFKTLSEATHVRKEAEEIYFKPYLDDK